MNSDLIVERTAKFKELLRRIGVSSLKELAHARLLLQITCIMKDGTFDVLSVIVPCGRIELLEENLIIEVPKEESITAGFDAYPYNGEVPSKDQWKAYEDAGKEIGLTNVDFNRDGTWSCFVDVEEGGGDFKAPYCAVTILT